MRKYGVLVIGHGSRSATWVKLVDDAVLAMRPPYPLPVACSFLELVKERTIQDGIDRLEAQGVTDLLVVPLFICSGSTHVVEIGQALGVNPTAGGKRVLPPFHLQAKAHYLPPLNDDPEVVEMLLDNIRPLSLCPAKEIVLVIAHGSREPEFQSRWRDVLAGLAQKLKQRGGFAHVEGAMLSPDQVSDSLRRFAERNSGNEIIAVPLFLSEGYFTKEIIPARLAGFACRYSGAALLPSPLLTRWLERRISDFLARETG